MKLVLGRFRVRKFRNIDDSGCIPVERVTAFVGRNESGKTALLKALHKFNIGFSGVDICSFSDILPRTCLGPWIKSRAGSDPGYNFAIGHSLLSPTLKTTYRY